jgi:hypothetical protein
MNLERSIQQLDDSFAKKSFLGSRVQNFRDDMSMVSSVSNYGSEKTSVLVKEKTDQLYSHFLSVIQSSSNEMEVFETVYHLRQVLENTIEEMESEGRKKKFLGANNWIRTEMNTWSLIHCLYKDRLITQKEEMEQDDLPLVNSEKLVVEHLYLSKLHLLDVLKFHWILLIIIF